MKLQRVNKTITVDPVKMSLFENTKNVHGLNISDFVDQKLEEFLDRSSPDEMQKIRIQELKVKLLEAEQSLPEIEFMVKMRRQQQNKVKKEEEEIDNKWFEKYEQGKESIATQVNKNHIDWKLIAGRWGFKNIQEAEEKITEQLNKDGLLGCQACKKWNTKTGYCSHLGKTTESNYSCSTWSIR